MILLNHRISAVQREGIRSIKPAPTLIVTRHLEFWLYALRIAQATFYDNTFWDSVNTETPHEDPNLHIFGH